MSDSPSPAVVCAITGAQGYVGSRIARAVEARGWKAVPLGRRSGAVPYTLDGGVDPADLKTRGVNALVHCAYDFEPRTWERIHAVNVEGTRRLFERAGAAGIERAVYISSTAAYRGCRSMYGRAKLESEEVARSAGAFVVRPGLVCGREPGGMVGTLLKVLRRSPVVPLIGSGRTRVLTVHEDDLAALIIRLLEEAPGPSALKGGPILAANEQAVEFRSLLRQLGEHEGRRSVVFAPLPWPLVWAGVKSLELAGLPTGMRSDSVISFVNTDPAPDFSYTHRTAVSFRPFAP
jgi:nucleoside-diphosphate-sugar epimerase